MSNQRSSRRRLALAIVIVFVVVGIFAVRLVDIQLVRADQFNADSLSKRAITTTTYAARGDIVDSNGVVLAGTVNRYDVTVAPVNMQKGFLRKATDGTKTTVTPTEIANEIATATKQDQSVVFQALTKNPGSNYALLAKAVDLPTRRAIEKLKIPGIIFQLHPIRTYPVGSVAGNLVGYTAPSQARPV